MHERQVTCAALHGTRIAFLRSLPAALPARSTRRGESAAAVHNQICVVDVPQ